MAPPARRARRQPTRVSAAQQRRIILLLALSVVAGVGAVAWLGDAPRAPARTGQGGGRGSGEPEVRAYQVAIGVFAAPDSGTAPPSFAAAEHAAMQTRNPLAFTIWVDQESFEAQAWRDVIQHGRTPVGRPPAIDFAREVAVLAWPVPGLAPARVLNAYGLALAPRGVLVRDGALEVRLGPTVGGPAPATPAAAALEPLTVP
jgi:hypothetical protein